MKKHNLKSSFMLCIAAGLVACNSGTNTPTELSAQRMSRAESIKNPTTKLQGALKSALMGENNYTLNLASALFINTTTGSYSYKIVDSSNNLILNGDFKCNSQADCLLNLGSSITTGRSYSVLFFDSNNSFIGASNFVYGSTELALKEIAVDAYTTSQYLASVLYDNTKNDTEMNLYNSVSSFNSLRGKPFSEIRYYYYIYLTTSKALSHDQAIQNMNDLYSACNKDHNSCSLDKNFQTNEAVVQDAIDKANAASAQYLKDKQNTSLAETHAWYESSIKPILDTYVISDGKMGIDTFFPGIGTKAISDTTAKAVVFTAIDMVFDKLGLADSQASLNRMRVFNTNISQVYHTAIPTLDQNISNILDELRAQGLDSIVADFGSHFYTVENDFQTVNSELFEANNEVSIEDYLYINHVVKSKPFTNNTFSWIVQQGTTDSGVFDSAAQKARIDAINYLTDPTHIQQLAREYYLARDYTGLSKEVENSNTIAAAHQYNQLLLSVLLDTIDQLQKSMYLDNITLILKENSQFSTDWQGLIAPPIFQIIGRQDLNHDYNKDALLMQDFYRSKIDAVRRYYADLMIPEKRFVADNVLQTLEVDGSCTITSTDGLNTIAASCPVYSMNKDGIIESQYITSELNKPNSACLTTNSDASGNIQQIAEIRNIYGTLACKSKTKSSSIIQGGDIPMAYDSTYGWRTPGTSWNIDEYMVNTPYYKQDQDWKRFQMPILTHGKQTPSPQKFDSLTDNAYYRSMALTITYSESDYFGNGVGASRQVTGALTDYFKDEHYASMHLKSASVQYSYTPYMNGSKELLPLVADYSNQRGILKLIESDYPVNIVKSFENLSKLKEVKVNLTNLLKQDDITLSSSFQDLIINTDSVSIKTVESMPSLPYNKPGNNKIPMLFVMEYNGNQISRQLLPGGQYSFDAINNKIVMDNWQNWENDSNINPFINPDAIVLSGSKISISVINNNLNCPNSDNLSTMKKTLTNQGRGEFGDYIVTYTGCKQLSPSTIQLELPFISTKLYIPFEASYDGYKQFTVWNSTVGFRADTYATASYKNYASCPYVDTYSMELNRYDGGHMTTSKNPSWHVVCSNSYLSFLPG